MIGIMPPKKSSQAIKAEAAQWFAKLRAPHCDADTQAAFEAWVKASPAHELAYEQCAALWLMTNGLRADEDIKRELDAARSQVELAHGRKDQRKFYQPTIKKLVQIAALVLIGIGFIISANLFEEDGYSTGVGEQRLIQLADGSTAMLNTDTKIHVNFSNGRRRIELVQGEAYFDVAKDPKRPFEVLAANNVVRAVGTEFNVALLDHLLSVDVAEGVVAFEAIAENKQALTTHINVGERIAYHKGDKSTTIEAAHLERISAWQEHKIYFNGSNLAEAVTEYNRYTKDTITIVDEVLSQQKITGIFNVGDLDTFIFSLEQALNVRVERKPGKVLLMKK